MNKCWPIIDIETHYNENCIKCPYNEMNLKMKYPLPNDSNFVQADVLKQICYSIAHVLYKSIIMFPQLVNPSLPKQNSHCFADDIFKYIFKKEKFCTSILISLKCVPLDLIDNKSALVQVMAWRRTGDKPLPEPMVTLFIGVYMWSRGVNAWRKITFCR